MWLAINITLPLLWLILFWPVIEYATDIFQRDDFRTNQILLIIILGLIVVRLHEQHFFQHITTQLSQPPRDHIVAVTMIFISTYAYIMVERFLDINTLSAMLFLLAGYGLLGLWVEPIRWRQGLPAVLLLICVLPIGDHMQTFIGYPMRILTAEMVGTSLATLGIPSVGVDTILVFENGISRVDIPCSGVKSLWTGAIFLLALTWIEHRPLNLRWWLIASVMPLLLFMANFVRVWVLVVVGEVAGLDLLAQMLHIPLGVIPFVLVCGIMLLLYRWFQPVIQQDLPKTEFLPRSSISGKSRWLAPFLLLWMGNMILLYTPPTLTGLTESVQPWTFPEPLVAEPLPLTANEVDWLTRDGAESAERYRFTWTDPDAGSNLSGSSLSGTMILITSRTWRAHHRPERCFEVYGLSLDDSRTHLLTGDIEGTMPVRYVLLGDGNGHSTNAATYWFQSQTQITDDYGTRIWADLSLERDQWVLVSMIFDEVVDPQLPEMNAFYGLLQQTVERRLLQEDS
ncbi:MAG: exosortase O [Chloroflexota bacterium]